MSNVLSLLSSAIYLSGLAGQDFNQPDNPETQNALVYLNEILSDKIANPALIPYYQDYVFNSVANQETYIVTGLIEVETLTFVINEARLPLMYVSRDRYNGSYRAETVQAIPQVYYYERTISGANLSMYFPPDAVYPFTLTGKFALSKVTLFDELSGVFPDAYIEYLKAKVASRICVNYGIPINNDLKALVKEKEIMLSNTISPPDLSVRSSSVFRSTVSPNYGIINIGNAGWLP